MYIIVDLGREVHQNRQSPNRTVIVGSLRNPGGLRRAWTGDPDPDKTPSTRPRGVGKHVVQYYKKVYGLSEVVDVYPFNLLTYTAEEWVSPTKRKEHAREEVERAATVEARATGSEARATTAEARVTTAEARVARLEANGAVLTAKLEEALRIIAAQQGGASASRYGSSQARWEGPHLQVGSQRGSPEKKRSKKH